MGGRVIVLPPTSSLDEIEEGRMKSNTLSYLLSGGDGGRWEEE